MDKYCLAERVGVLLSFMPSKLGAPMNPPNQPSVSKRRHLRELVYQKSRWNETLSAADKANGFLGWHERGYLPHCDKPGLVQFVTLRLVDSMPTSRHDEWEHLLKIEDARERRNQLELYLDRGVGSCWFRGARVAETFEFVMFAHHEKFYDLRAWCVMPNHVHALIYVWDWPLAKLLQAWKSITAIQCNRILKRTGSFWQREYWDTFMRDDEQERKAVHYIENNPVKARLCRAPEEWKFSSARFRDGFRKLTIPTNEPKNEQTTG
jgi:putative transposase